MSRSLSAPALLPSGMSTIGLVGGIAPESTIACYRLLVAGYRERFPDAYPTIVIDGVDMTTMVGYVAAGDRQSLAPFRSSASWRSRPRMEADFYPAAFRRRGIEVVLPTPEDRTYAHRAGLVAVIERLHRNHRVEAVVLGGTELPLGLGDGADSPVPFLDTTRLHTAALLEQAYPR